LMYGGDGIGTRTDYCGVSFVDRDRLGEQPA
jgi:hypothetical protein